MVVRLSWHRRGMGLPVVEVGRAGAGGVACPALCWAVGISGVGAMATRQLCPGGIGADWLASGEMGVGAAEPFYQIDWVPVSIR